MTAAEARAFMDSLPEDFDDDERLDDLRMLVGADKVEQARKQGTMDILLLMGGIRMMEFAQNGQIADTNATGYSRCGWITAKRLLGFLEQHPELIDAGAMEIHHAASAAGLTFADVDLTTMLWGWACDAACAIIHDEPVLGPIDMLLDVLPT